MTIFARLAFFYIDAVVFAALAAEFELNFGPVYPGVPILHGRQAIGAVVICILFIADTDEGHFE